MGYSKFDLTGKVALVTGGNGGIGLGFAEALAEAGADVCIWGRNVEKNKAAEEKLRAYGRRVLALPCDVTDQAQVTACFEETVATLGRVDACFANAGQGVRGTKFHEMTIKEWRELLAVNLDAVFFTLQSAARHMLERGGDGSLVVTSSLASISGMPRGEHYAAAKAGVSSMIRCLAVEYARNGIRANAVLPGWIETEMTGPMFGWESFAKAVLPRIPMRRWGRPEDFGGIAVYLASDASAYHSGDTFLIDGAYFLF